jgi:arylsulfatase A-like enzyme
VSDRPTNILLILTDQHRLSALSCYGQTPCTTPHLDALAAEGLRFETAYTTCPVCTPARASILTGCYPHGHGMMANAHEVGCKVHELTDGPDLLSRRLQSVGYRNGYTGKWHLGSRGGETWLNRPIQRSLPSDVGFEGQDFPGHGDGGYWYDEYKRYLAERGLPYLKWMGPEQSKPGLGRHNVLDVPIEASMPYFLAEHTIAQIDRFKQGGEPFFLWHNFWGPHEPYWVPKAAFEPYRDLAIPPWPNFEWAQRDLSLPYTIKMPSLQRDIPWSEWELALRHYYACASLIDSQIGRIVEHLRSSGLLEDTLVVMSADHGETLGSHGGLSDKGWHHFEEIQRIPFIVRVPESLGGSRPAPGTVMPEWVSLVDLYPTFGEIAGASLERDPAAAASQLHGRSLLPLLRGEPVDDWRDEIFVEFHGLGGVAYSMVTCRHGDLKYGWNVSNTDELYDLAVDPHEMHNCIADPAYSERLQAMRERLFAFMERTCYEGRGIFEATRLRRAKIIGS